MQAPLYFARPRPSIPSMGGDFDHSDFVDPDFDPSRKSPAASHTPTPAPSTRSFAGPKPPSRGEIDEQVSAAQKALVDLRQQQQELERERSQLEEARRRRLDYEQGREEMLSHLTRGVTLIEEQEQGRRREAEQLARTLAELRAALEKVAALNEQSWTVDNYQTELTRALTTLESARMEWNAALLKWPVLSAAASAPKSDESTPVPAASSLFGAPKAPAELARLGLALTWPVAAAVLVVGLILAAVLSRR